MLRGCPMAAVLAPLARTASINLRKRASA
jgi:hypothetical protein